MFWRAQSLEEDSGAAATPPLEGTREELPGDLDDGERDGYPDGVTRAGAAACLGGDRAAQVAWKRRSRRLLDTTNTLEKAIAAPASMGLSSPAAARGMAATL
jgi:hypothetical protein